MKHVLLREMTLRNFKGIQSITIPFSKETHIHGRNRAGKTTIADAYFWLLYGKDSSDRTDFALKTFDKQNNAIPKLEHEVSGTFLIDNEVIKLKKILKEKWVKKKGNEVEELTGHETLYFIDDVPTSSTDYKSKVSGIIDESISKILTNPNFFNEKMKWQDRRVILSELAGDITNASVIESISTPENPLNELKDFINSGKDLEDIKKKNSVEKKKLKDAIEQIPSRLDEIDRLKPEPENWEELETEIAKHNASIKDKNEKIDNVNASIQSQKDEIFKKQQEKFQLEQRLDQLSREETTKLTRVNSDKEAKISELSSKVQNDEQLKKNRENEIENLSTKIETLKSENQNLLEKFHEVQAETFAMIAGSDYCPTCKRQLDNASEIEEELRSNFNKSKLDRTEQINKKGLSNKEQIAEIEKQIEDLKAGLETVTESIEKNKAEIETIRGSFKPVPTEVKPTPEMVQLKKDIDAIEIPEIVMTDVTELRHDIQILGQQKDELTSKLQKKQRIEDLDKRSAELTEEKRTLSQELASLERIEFQIDKFNKAKSEFVENRVNSKFKFVKFKMFEQQLNGGEAPACECIVDGVPYSSLNTELKVNASLDIINTFQHYYGIFAPIFIDGRESITDLVPMNCQVVSLVVDPNETVLKVIN